MESVLDIMLDKKSHGLQQIFPINRWQCMPLNCKASMVQGEDIDNIDLYCKDVVSETCSV